MVRDYPIGSNVLVDNKEGIIKDYLTLNSKEYIIVRLDEDDSIKICNEEDLKINTKEII